MTPVTFFIDTCRDRIARPADFTCRGVLAYGNIPQSIFRYVSRSIISWPILYSATLFYMTCRAIVPTLLPPPVV
jgi:hypothetical protein